MSSTPKQNKNKKNSSKSSYANLKNSKNSLLHNLNANKSLTNQSKDLNIQKSSPGKNAKLGYSPLKNPFLLKKTKTMNKKKKLKLKNIKNVKSFDDRLKPQSVSNSKNPSSTKIKQMTSIEKKLNNIKINKNFGVFSPTPGILRHKNWKKIRKSSYSVALNNKKSKLNSSNNSKASTIDSLNLKNNFNKSNGENELTANTGRIDQFKNPIIRGKKRHKVSFARETKTINVENWKKINSKLTMKSKNNKGCIVCSVF